MNRQKRLSYIIALIIFAALLIGTAFSSKQILFHSKGGIFQKENALKKYGFYLQPDNQQAGISFRHESPELDPKLKHIQPLIASMGASVSIVDFNKDGWDDIYFTNSRIGSKNALYENLHNGKFKDVAAQMGLADLSQPGTGVSMGAAWGDYDNDGYPDVLIYKWGKPELFHNVDGKKFVNVTKRSGLPDWINANCAIWFDFNNDGLLDLFIGGYYNSKYDLSHLNTTKIMPESFRYANNGGGGLSFRKYGKRKI